MFMELINERYLADPIQTVSYSWENKSRPMFGFTHDWPTLGSVVYVDST